MHDIFNIEYKIKDKENALEVARNQSLNIGFFKVWQDIDLAFALGSDSADKVKDDPPFHLVYRICGTFWAVEYIAGGFSVQPRSHLGVSSTANSHPESD